MDACISVIENILQKLVGQNGAIATYAEYYPDLESNEPYFELRSVKIEGLTLKKYERSEYQDILAFIQNEGSFYFDHFGNEPKRKPSRIDITIAINLLTASPNVKYWLIYKDQDIIGMIQEFQSKKLGTPEETDLRLSPYMSVYQRGTRVMKTAYCTLAAALDDIEGKTLSWGITEIHNKPMQRIFEAAGLRRISESPVCPIFKPNRDKLSDVYALV